MAKPVRWLLRRTLDAGKPNLRSLDDPWTVLPRLLRGVPVTGVIDAGASDGRVARRLLRAFPAARVWGFEPQPQYAAPLADLTRAQPRFTACAAALLDHPGELTLHLTHAAGQTSLFAPAAALGAADPAGSRVVRTVTVPGVTLDDWWDGAGRPPVQLLKLDIQGAEAVALRGAHALLRTTVRTVYTEVNFAPLYDGGCVFGDVDALLRTAGFVLRDFYKPRHDAAGRLLWASAIYLRPQQP